MDGYDIYKKVVFGTSFCHEKRKKEARRQRKAKARRRKKEEKKSEYAAAITENSCVLTTNIDDSEDECSVEAGGYEVSHVENGHDDDNEENASSVCDADKGRRKERKKQKKEMSPMKMHQIQREQMTHFRRINKIHCEGTDIPDAIKNFEQLSDYNVHSAIMTNIVKLGYTAPTPVQMQVIPLLIHERQALVCAPTGSGKTAAFLIPILHTLKGPQNVGFRALILAPTRELAKQIYEECLKLAEGTNIRPCVIDSVKSVLKKPKFATKHDILISTPNRLIYMLQQEPPVISLDKVQWFIVDESDKLFETGKQGFRDQLATVYKACDSVNVKRAMFSATYAYDVEQWCKMNLDSIVSVSIGDRNTAVETVKQELLFVGSEAGKLLAFRDLRRKGLMPPVLVFVQSRERAYELIKELIFDDIRVGFIHAGRSQIERDSVVRDFHAGKIWILICTELMGRGIDFKGVNLVINYDFPQSAISYIHRIGRAGRAGQPGRAITFFTEEDFDNLRSIAQVMKNAGCEVPEYILQMKKRKRKNESALPVKRAKISTVPQYDIEREAKMKKLIENSKKRKLRKKNKEQSKHDNLGDPQDKQKDHTASQDIHKDHKTSQNKWQVDTEQIHENKHQAQEKWQGKRQGQPGHQGKKQGQPGYWGKKKGQLGHWGKKQGQPNHCGKKQGQPGHHGKKQDQPGHHGKKQGQPGHHGKKQSQTGHHGKKQGQLIH